MRRSGSYRSCQPYPSSYHPNRVDHNNNRFNRHHNHRHHNHHHINANVVHLEQRIYQLQIDIEELQIVNNRLRENAEQTIRDNDRVNLELTSLNESYHRLQQDHRDLERSYQDLSRNHQSARDEILRLEQNVHVEHLMEQDEAHDRVNTHDMQEVAWTRLSNYCKSISPLAWPLSFEKYLNILNEYLNTLDKNTKNAILKASEELTDQQLNKYNTRHKQTDTARCMNLLSPFLNERRGSISEKEVRVAFLEHKNRM